MSNYPPHQYGQQPPPQSSSAGSIIAVILVAVFLVVPIFAVLAIYGVRKYIASAKSAEALNSLGAIGRDAVEAYEQDHKLCASASVPVPAVASTISARKYQSAMQDWHVDDASNAGFSCLKFEMDSPQYYQYDYHSTGTQFTAIARGDLDGDGVFSEYTLTGKVVDGRLVLSSSIEQTNPNE